MNEKFTLWHISISWSLLKKLTGLTMLALLFPLFAISQSVTTFNYTGGSQTFTAPSTGAYKFETYGAQGGLAGGGGIGGLGGYATGTYTLTSGQTIYIYVGGQGAENSAGGFNGGGSTSGNIYGGSGGGATDIRVGGTALSNRVIVAGGGGGASGGSFPNTGGSGGGTTGGSGPTSGSYVGGSGGTQSAGGAGGTGYPPSQAGSLGQGGGVSAYHNPAGGGGYYGGGSGCVMGGGGGSSYTGGVTSGSTTSGQRSGNGLAVITNLYSASITETANILCNGASTGALSVSVNGSVGPYTYSWSPNVSSSSSATNLAAGSYTVTVTSSTSATTTASYTITQPSALTATTSQTNVSCNGGANGTATVSVSGGTASYAYSWSPSGGTAATATGRTAGAYTCTITDANGCTLTKSFTIIQPSALNAATSQVNVSCNGGANGTATVVASGGTGAYTYSWSPSGGTGATTTGRTAGAYTCTITDANSCTLTKSFTITQPSALVASAASQTNVSCNAGSNGAATVSVTGGTTAYSYNWTPGNPTGDGTASVTGLTAGTWTCTVTDANSCTTTQSFTVTQPTALSLTAASQTNVSCFGGSNGAASVNTATGGAGGYTYNWTPGNPTGDGTVSVTGLIAGTWICTATDANGCITTQSFTVTQPSGLVLTPASQTNIACNGGSTGAASVNAATGGTGTKTYNWTPGNPTGDGTISVTGLTAGIWTCTATDANGCSTTQSFTLSQPTALAATTSQTNVSCNGGSNGTATVVVSGGVSTYTYAWSPSGGTGATASGLSVGAYTCTITDALGCTLTQSFTITQPSALTGSTVVSNVTCNEGSNGVIDLTPSGGTPGYTYNWSSGPTTQDRTGLTAGTYSVVVTDANGCTKTISTTLTQPSAIAGSTVVTNAACFGGSNGSINLTPSGGTSPYTFNWGGGITTEDRTGLVAGPYSVTITDINGCTGTVNVTVTQPSAIAGSTIVTNVVCNGGSNGAINLTPSGGTPVYMFNWGGGITTEDRTGIVAGPYSVIITDVNGCTGTVNVTVTQPSAIAGSTVVTNVACNGGSNGAINLTPSGGTPGYTYNWGGGITTEDRTGLTAGTYSVVVTDANGCTKTVSATVTQPTAIAASTSQVNVSCNGGTNGSATVVVSGGVSTYTYAWSPSGGTGATASSLSAGAYTCTITDANGCTLTRSFTITQPSALAASTSQVNVSCNGGSNGSATVVVSGGVSAYTYSWSPSGGTGATASGLSAGAYTFTITDANGCTLTRSFTITQPSALAATTSQVNVSCNGGTNGSATVVVSGGVSTYTYAWSPSGGTAATASGLSAGAFTCTITDANGCELTKSFTITQPAALAASTSQVNVICIGGNNGSASVIASGGTAAYSYAWLPNGGTAATASNLTAGNYTCTITDANGCTLTKSFSIIQSDLVNPVAVAKDVTIFLNNTGNASITASEINDGSTDNCSISSLSASKTDFTCADLGTNNVTLTVTDASGNSSAAIAVVTLIDDLSPVADVSDLSDATGECSASVIAPTATDNCAGVITATTSDPLTYDAQGSYLIHWTYSDGNGNSSTQEQKVVVADVTAPVADVAMLSDVTGECSASVIAPTAIDNCAGVITATTSDPLTYDAQGSYLIHWTYSDGNGNSSTQEQKVVVADITAPVADVAILSDVTGECSASVIAPTATDNCAGVLTATTADPLNYDVQGSYIIHWTYSDGNGNSSTQNQNVIVKDVTAPVADAAILTDVTGECSASVIAPTAIDNCAGVITATTSDPLTYDAQGSYLIHWTYSDGNGNSSTQEQKVIVADVTAPLIACTNDITVIAQESVGHYLIAGSAFDPESVTDNCGITTLLNNVTNTSTLDGATLGVGSNVVTWTATDKAGNTSTCTTNITVQLNVGIPELSFKNVSVYPNPSKGIFTLEVPGSCTAVIYDVRGRIIQTEKMVDKLNKLDLTKCQQGVYLLKLIKDEQVVNMKLIVE